MPNDQTHPFRGVNALMACWKLAPAIAAAIAWC